MFSYQNRDKKNHKVQHEFSFSAVDLPLRQFAFLFSRDTGMGFVFSESLDNKKVTAEFVKASPSDVVEYLSRRFEVNTTFSNSTFYLGPVSDTERSVFVRRVFGYTDKDIKGFVETLSAQSGRAYCSPDGVLVVTDKQNVINRVIDLIENIESVNSPSWALQFFIVTFMDSKSFDAGFDGLTSGELSLLLSKGSGFSLDYSDLGLRLRSILEGSSASSSVVASPLFLLRDGSSCSWSDGSEIPVPQKTVSDSGTVTTNGFTNKKTGLSVEAKIRESRRGVLIDFVFKDSSITGYVEYSPILSLTEFKTQFELFGSDYCLIGELLRRKDSDSQAFFKSGFSDSRSRCLVFCRAFRYESFSSDGCLAIEQTPSDEKDEKEK